MWHLTVIRFIGILFIGIMTYCILLWCIGRKIPGSFKKHLLPQEYKYDRKKRRVIIVYYFILTVFTAFVFLFIKILTGGEL